MVKLATFSWMLKSNQYPITEVEWKQREVVFYLRSGLLNGVYHRKRADGSPGGSELSHFYL